MDDDIKEDNKSEGTVKGGLEEENNKFGFSEGMSELPGGHPGPEVGSL